MEIVMFPRKLLSHGGISALIIMLLAGGFVTGDVEPNDTTETAENINLGQVILGSLDATSDIHDVHNITLEGNNEIVAILDGPADADFNLAIYDSEGLPLAGAESDWDADEVVAYTPPSNGTYFVEVFANLGSGSYTLEVKIPDVAPNTTYELTEAVSQGYIKVALYGVYLGSAESFNLETGENVFFGRCVEIEIVSVVANDLDIIVPQGLLLVADNEAVENKVITSRHKIPVEALSKTTSRLLAMSTNMKKNVPDAWSSFQTGDMAEGDLKKVADELNGTDSQEAAGQIAVWMVTDSAKRDALEQLGASDSEIEEALDIMDSVGVKPPFAREDPDSGLLTCVGLVILVIALIVIIAYISSRSKGKSQIFPMEEKNDNEERVVEDEKSN
jgi:hypothetical protein